MVAEDLRDAENLLDWREQRENLCTTFSETRHTLWTISRQLSLRLVVTDEPAGQQGKGGEVPAHPS
jgi:hypothetical protein